MKRTIIVIAHNLRSSHNVGSLLRTADGVGVAKIYLTGYTPYPCHGADKRLPHIAKRVSNQIHKTALGAEDSVIWEQSSDVQNVIVKLKTKGYKIVALEQAAKSVSLPDFIPPEKVAVIIGNETEGIDSKTLSLASEIVEIPMRGSKESYNVVQAAAMALYHCEFMS